MKIIFIFASYDLLMLFLQNVGHGETRCNTVRLMNTVVIFVTECDRQ